MAEIETTLDGSAANFDAFGLIYFLENVVPAQVEDYFLARAPFIQRGCIGSSPLFN